MKGPQLSGLIWLANLLVLAGGAFFGYQFWKGIKTNQDTVYAKASHFKVKEKRIDWQDTVEAGSDEGHSLFSEVLVSPHTRPVPPKKVDPNPVKPPPPPPPPSDAQLKAELEKWVNDQFTLLRLWYGPPSVASAVVTSKEAKNATLIFRAGLKFPDEYGKGPTIDANVQKLAKYDLEVVKIDWDHVVMKGASRNPKYKDRHYEVDLRANPKDFEMPDINKLGKSGHISQSKLKLPDKTPPDPNVEVKDTRPLKSTLDRKTDTWTLGTEDYKNINVDQLGRYAKVVLDKNGKAVGIQISDDIPDDNTVISRGGRKGDIIKSINGKSVASMSDVRRIVRTEYNNGVEKFVVGYERDGLPGTKTFNVPHKKNNGK